MDARARLAASALLARTGSPVKAPPASPMSSHTAEDANGSEDTHTEAKTATNTGTTASPVAPSSPKGASGEGDDALAVAVGEVVAPAVVDSPIRSRRRRKKRKKNKKYPNFGRDWGGGVLHAHSRLASLPPSLILSARVLMLPCLLRSGIKLGRLSQVQRGQQIDA